MHRPTCRHCGTRPANRPRGLCWGCYYRTSPEDYPSMSKFARRGIGNHNRGRSPPPAPTSALPGSAEKVAILCQRAALGVSLWHGEDVAHPPEPTSRREGPHRSQIGFPADFGGPVFFHGRRVS
jgi:hypothetical protein